MDSRGGFLGWEVDSFEGIGQSRFEQDNMRGKRTSTGSVVELHVISSMNWPKGTQWREPTIADSLCDDDAPRTHEAACVGRCRERIDAHAAARGRRMNEAFVVYGDAVVQFLVREMHEDKIAFMHLAARDRHTGVQLFVRGTRHRNTRVLRRIRDQAAAVEPTGRSAAPTIRLADHGLGVIHHDYPSIRA